MNSFNIDSEKTIHINRGDRGTIRLINNDGNFEIGDKIKFSIVEKKNYNKVYLQKEYTVTEASEYFYITLESDDTRFVEVISKPKTFWYEIEYNGTQTLIGYDTEGAKKIIIYPEAPEKGDD